MFAATCRFAFGLLTLVSLASFAQAQFDAKPVSQTGGYTGQAMQQIYRENVGTGFSGSSLNMIALQNAQARVPFVGQTTTSFGVPRVGSGFAPSNITKPFSSYTAAPTVSPYMNLFREDLEGGSDINYNTLVRPQLQQQAFNQQVQREIDYSVKMQSIAAQNDYNAQGSKDILPTGHQTAFRYTGRYYPGLMRRGR